MDWKVEAEEKLRRYNAMCAAVASIPQEIRRLQIASYSLGSPGAEPSGGSKKIRGREERMLNNMAHRQELKWRLEQAKQWLEVTERAMRCLNADERQILEQLYIRQDKGGLDYLCRELGLEKSSVYRRREQALNRFATALYGV